MRRLYILTDEQIRRCGGARNLKMRLAGEALRLETTVRVSESMTVVVEDERMALRVEEALSEIQTDPIVAEEK